MANRDEFTKEVKTALAERVGYRCSFPACMNRTIGPSDESEMARSRVGVACHISAAAPGPGARRYDASLSPRERSSISNGIWMCTFHAKLIDTDAKQYPSALLKQWRAAAEERAAVELKSTWSAARNLSIRPFTHAAELVAIGNENKIIGDALKAAGLTEAWGAAVASLARDLCVEVARNAFQHGGASQFRVETGGRALRLSDDGGAFDILSLAHHPRRRGAGLVVDLLLNKHADTVLLTSQRVTDRNEYVLAKLEAATDIPALTPCAIHLDFETIRRTVVDIAMFNTCTILYVIMPEYSSASDAYLFAQQIKNARAPNSVVFVLRDASEAMKCGILHALPEARIVCLP